MCAAQLGRRGRRLWLSGVSHWLAGSDSVMKEGNNFNVEMTAFKSSGVSRKGML